MTNVQQPEMRRTGTNPLVQESKTPRPGDRRAPGAQGGGARPVPPEQVSPYGPAARPVAESSSEDEDEAGV
ncbi:hypothetical protein SAMN05444365_101837 [Micromonospora pattaloongensis]|uniref:Uncharacterized protein n=1 Tax=Micromonospora pattaloongensis TaxID=405436 RepID=A0A1H3HH96_9ACTN|nr:hypothetical protein [Micromonospora pattaloongensis]SDY14847.1 hypothetical protein SAMN05444365_101837 [Micromonospora pattaloongensis]